MKTLKMIACLILILTISSSIFSQDSSDLPMQILKEKLATKVDSLSYAMAILSYNSWIKENITLNPVIFAKALLEAKTGNSFMTDEFARTFIMSFVTERQTQQAELDRNTYKDYIASNEAFLAKNREKPGVTVTPSGLQYEVKVMGTGPKPARNNTVKVHYTGTLIDGTEFDSSIKRNAPAQFPLSGVIAGWTEALQLMPVGSRFILYIPESLGYGSKGAGGVIKPFSTLIFEVELLEIVN